MENGIDKICLALAQGFNVQEMVAGKWFTVNRHTAMGYTPRVFATMKAAEDFAARLSGKTRVKFAVD